MPLWLFAVVWVAAWWVAHPRRWAPLIATVVAFAAEAAWALLA